MLIQLDHFPILVKKILKYAKIDNIWYYGVQQKCSEFLDYLGTFLAFVQKFWTGRDSGLKGF